MNEIRLLLNLSTSNMSQISELIAELQRHGLLNQAQNTIVYEDCQENLVNDILKRYANIIRTN